MIFILVLHCVSFRLRPRKSINLLLFHILHLHLNSKLLIITIFYYLKPAKTKSPFDCNLDVSSPAALNDIKLLINKITMKIQITLESALALLYCCHLKSTTYFGYHHHESRYQVIFHKSTIRLINVIMKVVDVKMFSLTLCK